MSSRLLPHLATPEHRRCQPGTHSRDQSALGPAPARLSWSRHPIVYQAMVWAVPVPLHRFGHRVLWSVPRHRQHCFRLCRTGQQQDFPLCLEKLILLVSTGLRRWRRRLGNTGLGSCNRCQARAVSSTALRASTRVVKSASSTALMRGAPFLSASFMRMSAELSKRSALL